MAWLTAYAPKERDGKVLLHYTLLDPQGRLDRDLCTLHGEVRHGRVYAYEYGPDVAPDARGKLEIEHVE